MMINYIFRAVEMLIMEADFFPVMDSSKGGFSVDEKYSVLKKVTGKKVKFLEIYNCDLLSIEDITSKMFCTLHKIEKSETANTNVLYIKLLIFSKMPSDAIISNIKNTYKERIKDKNDFVCMAVCLEKRNIVLAEGIVYPHHIIYDVFAKSFESNDENYEVDIMKVIEEKRAENEPHIIIEDEEKNIIETLSFNLSIIYMVVFMLINAINMWVKVFSGSFFLRFFDFTPLIFIINLVFLLTVGIMVENNYRGMKLLVIMLVGGILSTILISAFIVYSFIVPIIGALLYMIYRTGEALDKAKFIKSIVIFYVVFIVGWGIFIRAVPAIIPLAGIIPGFCTAGILGFDGDVTDSNIKKQLFIILLLYVFAAALISLLWI